jgi:uncharacterized LabA/DUF88 family protein
VFVPLIEYIRLSTGKQAEVMAFGENTSSKLIEAADDFVDLSQDKGKFLIGDRRYYKKVTAVASAKTSERK